MQVGFSTRVKDPLTMDSVVTERPRFSEFAYHRGDHLVLLA